MLETSTAPSRTGCSGTCRTSSATFRGARVAVLGLAFKPDTDDVRESPALPIIAAACAKARRWWRTIRLSLERTLGPEFDGIDVTDDLERVVATADALLLITSWSEYKRLPELIAARGERRSPAHRWPAPDRS